MTLNPSLFIPLWQGLIGKEITLVDIKTVLEGIEDTYRQHDYRASAIVPPQDFATGRINARVRRFSQMSATARPREPKTESRNASGWLWALKSSVAVARSILSVARNSS